MKNFLKYTLATILGIFVTGMILFIIGIVGLTGLLVSSTSSTTKIDDSSIFVLDLQGCITERYQENPFNLLLGETQGPIYGLDDILTSIRKAKENKQIKGIFLNAGLLDCAPASLQAIRNALADFKQSKKFIVAYSGAYTQGCYYIASIADKLIVNPTGSISWHGLSAQTIFLKDLLAKVGIEMQVFRVGTYKSAVEPYTETTMSVANREQTMDFLQSIWKQIKEEVAQSRTISTDSLNMLADWNMDMQPAETYLSTGLADTLMYQDEVLSYLKSLTNKKESDELVTLTIEDMINLPDNKTSQALNTIAVYYAFGEIGSEDLYEENINAEKSETLEQVENLIMQISSAQSEIDELNTKISDMNNQIEDAQNKLNEKQEEYDGKEELLEKRLVAAYEAGETSYLDVLLSSSSLTDLISNYYMISEVTQSDMELMEKIKNEQEEIETAKQTLETSKQELDSVRAQKQQKATELQNAKSQKDSYVAQLDEQEKNTQAELEQFEQDKRDIQAQLAAIARQEAASAGSSNVSNIVNNPSSSGYIRPVAGYRITCGWMGYSGHTGVDNSIKIFKWKL